MPGPRCRRSIAALLAELPRVNVSIKLSALDSQFDPIDPEGTARRVSRAAADAAARGPASTARSSTSTWSRISTKDLTLAIFQRDPDGGRVPRPERRGHRHPVLSARRRGRSACALRDWAQRRGRPVWVRLVKGAYWDYETVLAQAHGWPVPVFEQKWETDANYERLTRLRLRAITSTCGRRWAATTCARWRTAWRWPGTWACRPAASSCKCSTAWPTRRSRRWSSWATACGSTCPYGELIPGMAYLVRRLLENTSNDSFLRASFAEQRLAGDNCS